jgi:hypothetical protein
MSTLSYFPTLAALCLATFPNQAQDTYRLYEILPVGAQYTVSGHVEVAGSLTLPLEKGQTSPKTLPVVGISQIDYGERVLTLNKLDQAKTTIRSYRQLEFNRKVGDQAQASTLRPEVRRMVILRHNQVEVPFSPDGPMTWNELDLIRTDVFTPALSGFLPTGPVRLNQRWNAAAYAVQELTDLDKIEEGTLVCELEKVAQINGRRQARIGFSGTVRGVGEDGPTRHQLDGHLLFDLESNYLSFLSVRGSQQLLDKDGKVVGKIEGTFVLTRKRESSKDLGDDALRPLKLEPNEENTQLLYDNTELGVRFLYPRRWRVAGVRGRQVAVDENGGSGLLLTLETLQQTPTAAQFLQESKTWLEQEKVKMLKAEPTRQLQAAPRAVDQFALDVEINGQRVLMDYLVLRQAKTGATIAARVVGTQQALIVQDIEKIARSVELK